MHKHTLNDGIRMVGQLLLHNGTTKSYARDKNYKPVAYYRTEACCFCLHGAVRIVSRVLKVNDLWKDWVVQNCPNFEDWDMASDSQRRAYALKLSRTKGA